jgi:proteasome accessory factor A
MSSARLLVICGIFGPGSEYSVIFSARVRRRAAAAVPAGGGSARLGPVVSRPGAIVLLRSGARLYPDVVSGPEWTTPECGSVPGLVVHDKAGDRILALLTGVGVVARRG